MALIAIFSFPHHRSHVALRLSKRASSRILCVRTRIIESRAEEKFRPPPHVDDEEPADGLDGEGAIGPAVVEDPPHGDPPP